jgi:hypothetical protein
MEALKASLAQGKGGKAARPASRPAERVQRTAARAARRPTTAHARKRRAG